MITIIFIANLICWFLISRDGIKRSESGKRFIENIDLNTTNLLKWKADSTITLDLKRLSKIFKIISLSYIGLTLIFLIFKIQPGFYFGLSALISIFLWTGLVWGINPKKEFVDWIKYIGILLISPWFFYLIDVINNPSQGILQTINHQIFSQIGLYLENNIEIAIFLTCSLLIGAIIISLFWIVQNVIIALLFILTIWSTIRFSKTLLSIKEATVINIAYFLSPIFTIILYVFK